MNASFATHYPGDVQPVPAGLGQHILTCLVLADYPYQGDAQAELSKRDRLVRALANSPGASSRGGKKSGSGSSSKQGGTTAQKKAAGAKGGKAAARKK